MAFRLNPPRIPLDKLVWDEIGEDDNPRSRLLAHIEIGPVSLHLEAWEVTERDDGNGSEQVAVEGSARTDDLDRLQTMMDCAFTTLDMNGRSYVLVATPYGS
ncbi:hypothetical protein [Aureimonas sp. AU40]|uniref:hypothetical protein n=1 Tax=Aureimonas sp. AU40 TaxID=1637747 RepID=UPI000782B429|nr:hypothetical protein [Aureimonas sp. AU40]